VPIAVFEGTTIEEVLDDFYELQVTPLSYITDPKHPIFKQYSKMFEAQGVTEKIKLIILSVGYTKQFLA
jgi:ATP-dependent protease Clp ATPase subunit